MFPYIDILKIKRALIMRENRRTFVVVVIAVRSSSSLLFVRTPVCPCVHDKVYIPKVIIQ